LRAENRLIDPTTNEIYHKTLNPPNEGDKKLMERLKPVEVNLEQVKAEVEKDLNSSEALIKRIKFEFGIQDEFGKLPLLNEINGENEKSVLIE